MNKTDKEKTLLTLILLVPFTLLLTGNPAIQILLVIYAGILIYMSMNKDFMIKLSLPPICEDHPDNKNKEVVYVDEDSWVDLELPGLSEVRRAEQRIRDELHKSVVKKLLKKPSKRLQRKLRKDKESKN